MVNCTLEWCAFFEKTSRTSRSWPCTSTRMVTSTKRIPLRFSTTQRVKKVFTLFLIRSQCTFLRPFPLPTVHFTMCKDCSNKRKERTLTKRWPIKRKRRSKMKSGIDRIEEDSVSKRSIRSLKRTKRNSIWMQKENGKKTKICKNIATSPTRVPKSRYSSTELDDQRP